MYRANQCDSFCTMRMLDFSQKHNTPRMQTENLPNNSHKQFCSLF